jgi:N-formylglutamate amidohydrolase
MDGSDLSVTATVPPLDVRRPAAQTVPMVVASPHSGANYPAEFVAASRLDPLTLRRSEDAFVDEIFAAAPRLGAPMLAARFPRAYLDVNREAWELDPTMFADALPDWVNVRSPRVRMGLGTIARVVASGEEIYGGKLSFAEARQRVEQLYQPYHAALGRLIEDTAAEFGFCLVVDCHSMPSGVQGSTARESADIVLGDCHGASCAPQIVECARKYLARRPGITAGRVMAATRCRSRSIAHSIWTSGAITAGPALTGCEKTWPGLSRGSANSRRTWRKSADMTRRDRAREDGPCGARPGAKNGPGKKTGRAEHGPSSGRKRLEDVQ